MTNTVFNVDWENNELDLGTITEVKSFFDEPADLPIEYADDALTLSCVSYRLWLEKSWIRWSRLEEVTDKVTEADRVMAQNIRDYYVSRLTFARLCNIPLTAFQENLGAFLIDKRVLKTSEQGLLYCLPYFYAEDCGKDWVFENTEPVNFEGNDEHPFPKHITFEGLILSPIKEVYAFRKTGDKHLFWFKDQKNHPFVFEIKTGNTLISLFRSLFKRQKITIDCSVRAVKLNGPRRRQSYYKILDPELCE